jgi:hypothetical protein
VKVILRILSCTSITKFKQNMINGFCKILRVIGRNRGRDRVYEAEKGGGRGRKSEKDKGRVRGRKREEERKRGEGEEFTYRPRL